MRRHSLLNGWAAVIALSASASAASFHGAHAGSVGATAALGLGGEHRPHAGMLRFPDISAKQLAFVYANDIWVVSREGGTALPLASPPGQEAFPRFSPDGQRIAFMGNYEGDEDLYVIDAAGGIPARVTYHPASEVLCDWTPDGRLLFFSNALAPQGRMTQLLVTSADGGLPEKLPVPYGANGAVSPDGQWLAYTPHSRDHRTWKRYRGGMATDIWLFHLTNHTSKRITDWEGTDSQPMWHGETVYYLSDAGPAHRLNIWSYDTKTGRRQQVTLLKDYDAKWPAIGPGPDGGGEIVFQNGVHLSVVDLRTKEVRNVEVVIPGDRPKIKPQTADAGKFIHDGNISSTGKRAVLQARGDIWTVPAEHGSPRNLTRTSGVAERDPAWSPDGQWIAYFSDESGEYELYITQSDGRGETKRLTHDGKVFRYGPAWSPDSKHVAFTDKGGGMYLYSIEASTSKQFDTDMWSNQPRLNWSPDSRWIVYTKAGENHLDAVWLYNREGGEKHQVTSGMFNDTWPTFDRKGEYLFFASNREFSSPIYEDVGTTFVYANTDVLSVVPLRAKVGSPFAPKTDEETWEKKKDGEEPKEEGKEEDKADGDEKENSGGADEPGEPEADKPGDEEKKPEEAEEKQSDEEPAAESKEKDEKKPEEVKPVEIELDGFEARAIALPVDRGSFTGLSVNDKGHLIYVRQAPRGSDGESAIKLFDLKDDKKKEKTVLEGAGAFALSADGKKLLARKGDKMAIIDAKPDQKFEKPLSTDNLHVTISPREEWKQLFLDAWRIQRDFFYDPNMHGVDWHAMRERYAKMLADCASREDVSYVIGELQAELNVGHAYVRGGGDTEEAPSISVGMLGVDFELDNGAYRITRIHAGAPWDLDARGPLSQPGVDVKEGDYLLAVNGVPVDTSKDPWAAFQGLGGKTVTITVSAKATMDDDARTVTVELMRNEDDLRYRAWVERNRAYVAEKTGGQVGYIYVPNTGVDGQNNLFRQFYGQVDRGALIIDERWNGGGQIPTRFVELLNRPIANYWARRDGHDWPWPPDSHQGPKCMLINGLAGSGGDYFPWWFRAAGVGKLIGMRTWGGLVGISGNPLLIDGGRVTAPTFAFYEKDGTWGVEGHGVDPDIEVVDDPALMVDGGDPQLDAAIQHMLDELERSPYTPPKRPTYPNRSGMGIKPEDK